jgi:hypothetical protein
MVSKRSIQKEKSPTTKCPQWADWQPKDFKPTHCTDLIKVMSKGKGMQTFCAQNNLTRQLFYTWLNKYSDFKLSYEIGKLKLDEYLLDLLHEYKIETATDGTTKMNVQIYREIRKATREAHEKREAVMHVNLGGDTKTMMTSVLNALGAGLIDLDDAAMLANLIETNQRVGENSELFAKVEQLEQALQSGVKQDEFKEE